MPDPVTIRRPSRIPRVAVLLVGLVCLLAGCQAHVTVDTKVHRDGSGVLSVGLGLDDAAVARIGDLGREVRLGDLAAAGWAVTPAQRGADGITWLRATRPFTDVADLNRSLSDLTGPPGMFRDYRLVKDDSGTAYTYRLTGTVDGTQGMAPFGDAALAARLGGDPFGGRIDAAVKEEGRPVSQMVSFDVSASVDGGSPEVVHPTLADTAVTPIEATLYEPKPATTFEGSSPVGVFVAGGILVVAMLTVARKRFSQAWS